MKKFYQKPELTVLSMEPATIIATSGGTMLRKEGKINELGYDGYGIITAEQTR